MAELTDYSGDLMEGEFSPEMVLENFSKETLIKLVRYISKLYVRLGGDHENAVERRWGAEAAHEVGDEAWMYHRSILRKWLQEVFDYQHGSDVEIYMKYHQINPAGGLLYPTKWEMISPTHAIYTILACDTLEYWERIKDDTNICRMCLDGGYEWKFFQAEAQAVNPKMKVTMLKSPPRQSEDEIACQWEFKIEE
ncbi:DUF6125 family protein [Neptuniibacter sp.]|uniref:DUF6125 family protein n=1 Tax=Neptuniibacter sp. TaxID=1962643 RepID=UPI0026137404|nr:DUF6125 family protein [Neptuniibacter sp.]MCP4595986.1 hypothetical protein [Neptuniibacter sp.]